MFFSNVIVFNLSISYSFITENNNHRKMYKTENTKI